MTFEFAGDDDVWIFIDDVLVADLGGIHNMASVAINFATGKVTINNGNDNLDTTIYSQYVAAEKENTVNWTQTGGNTIFEDGSCHTLKFFYLERGNTDSNLDLKYNLGTYPATDISKVDQYGNGVEDATFDVYAADGNYNVTSAKSLYTGTTDENGKMTFVDGDGMPYTIAELEQMFGTHFVLKETAPAGYRQVGSQINLEVIGHKLLACNNPQESGAQASATLQIEAPNALIPVSGSLAEAKTYYNYNDRIPNLNGTLFAVVLRYIGPREDNGIATEANLGNQANWAPVYGTQKDGFTVVDVSEYNNDFIAAVIDTAKRYVESDNVFSFDKSSATVQAQLNGMPGDIRNYYYMLDDKNKGKTEYTVAYYYSEADSLENATAANTQRINSDNNDDATWFSRVFGSNIQIPNLTNRMFVQKLDQKGNLVNGATFAMYHGTGEK